MTRKVCLSALMLAWALCSGVAAAAHASGTEAGHGQIEAGMRVRGEITVDTTGNVVGYKLHEEKKLPALVATFVRDSIASWKFQPLALEGSAMAVRNTMELFVVARQRDEQYELRMQAVGFRPTERAHGYEVTVTSLTPPTFPAYAMGTGAAGTVYLLLRVGRDGAVQDVVAEQVNLHVRGSADMLATLRSAFETASVDAARTWRFAPCARRACVGEGLVGTRADRFQVVCRVQFQSRCKARTGCQARPLRAMDSLRTGTTTKGSMAAGRYCGHVA